MSVGTARARRLAWDFASAPARSVDSASELPTRSPIAVALSLVLLSGCGGWRIGSGLYVRHSSPPKRARKEATFAFGDPGTGWTPVRNLKDVQVAWIHRELGGLIELHAQCDDQGDSSLDQFTDHLRIDWDHWEVESQEQERLVGRAALHTVALAELDGIERRNEFWVVKKNGCLFDLRYSANPTHFDDGRAAFDDVVAGFRFPVRG